LELLMRGSSWICCCSELYRHITDL